MPKQYQPRLKQLALCPQCKTPFIKARTDARFCSNACRQTAHRQRETDLVPRTVEEFEALQKETQRLWAELQEKINRAHRN